MFVYPEPDPIAFVIGPLKVHWYGLMYLLSFILGWALAVYRTRLPHYNWKREEVGDYLFYVVLGVVIGGRVGYMVFYQPEVLISNPLQLFYVWQGGMSFHGGLIGVILASLWYAYKNGRSWFEVTDFVAPIVPIGLFFGRIGNFINGELVGRLLSDWPFHFMTLPWAMVYPEIGPRPRHPSELYEALFEGVILFVILWWFSSKPRPRMAVSGLFLLGYGCFRFGLEFFRLPDQIFVDPGQHLGFVAFGWMTMGQVLCIPMIIFGVLFLVWAYTRERCYAA